MKEELKSIGLTDGETEVYLALLKLGESTNSPIARHSKLQSSTVYYCLNSLIEKGFVKYILKGDRKHFSAINPENILSILNEREKEFVKKKQNIKLIIPKLKQYQYVVKDKTTAEVYEGAKGFQAIFNQILAELRRGDQYEAFVIEQSMEGSKEIENLFIKHNIELKKRGIKLRLLANESMRNIFEKIYGKHFLKTYQEIRYTPQTIPAGITIYKDNVITHVNEENLPISIKVRNKKLAQMYRDFFNSEWKQAKS